MNTDIIILIIMVIALIVLLLWYYKPHIEILISDETKHKTIRLWYTAFDGTQFFRTYIILKK